MSPFEEDRVGLSNPLTTKYHHTVIFFVPRNSVCGKLYNVYYLTNKKYVCVFISHYNFLCSQKLCVAMYITKLARNSYSNTNDLHVCFYITQWTVGGRLNSTQADTNDKFDIYTESMYIVE